MSDGNVSKVANMVEAKMPGDILDEYDNTALRWAAYFNQTHVVLFLFQKYAGVDKRGRDGQRLLHIAIMKNSTDVIRMLQQNELIRDIKNDYGRTTIDVVGSNNSEEAVGLLQQYQVNTSYKSLAHILLAALLRLKCNLQLNDCFCINKKGFFMKKKMVAR